MGRAYSVERRRSLIAMVAGRALRRMNGTANMVVFKPLVVMAARVLGPGPTRLRLVKLAHQLDHGGVVVAPAEGFGDRSEPAVQPSRRAA